MLVKRIAKKITIEAVGITFGKNVQKYVTCTPVSMGSSMNPVRVENVLEACMVVLPLNVFILDSTMKNHYLVKQVRFGMAGFMELAALKTVDRFANYTEIVRQLGIVHQHKCNRTTTFKKNSDFFVKSNRWPKK